MAKTPTTEFFSSVKSYLNQMSEGERTPTEVASALNDWARESAESIKAKISEEVERTVSKMGFVKLEEYEELLARVAKLEKGSVGKVKAEPAKKISKKEPAKSAVKSSAKSPRKSPTKSAVKSPTKSAVKSSTKKASK